MRIKYVNLPVFCLLMTCMPVTLVAQQTEWPAVNKEMKPGTRWWWMGSAVDSTNLTLNIRKYAQAGIGTLEITPIYGVKNNEKNDIRFLSEQWMNMYKHTCEQAGKNNIQIDMNTGTGWPFGGPTITVDQAACKLFVSEYQIKGGKLVEQTVEVSEAKQKPYAKLERLMAFSDKGKVLNITSLVKDGKLSWKVPKGNWRLIAAFCGKTLQKVKRAAPGGEGYVIDHFSKDAVSHYLKRFDDAFESSQAPAPHNFFNDSYEVYKADWTEGLFDKFYAMRGYKLEEHLPEFLAKERTDTTARIIADYRETLAELLLENFTRQWTAWAHGHNSLTRNQAHGSPGNLIDIYATVDIPECEGFGLSDFHIQGLRKDTLTRPNDSDLSMLKYASSAAHIAGKPYTSSETFTWLTEHFRTSLSQCKPDIDLMFVSGVNHTYFHGTTYSPAEAAWPGWKFYATVDMSPTNSIWRDAPAFFDYIERCQSFLQSGKPDNDFLVYLPVYDMWQEQGGRLLMFDIHGMAKRAPRFIDAVHRINNAGYDMDYISDNFIRTSHCENGKIITSGGQAYKALVIPGARLMPVDVLKKLLNLAKEGATIVFLDCYPEDVPGYAELNGRRKALEAVLRQIKNFKSEGKGKILLGTDYAKTLQQTNALPEPAKTDFGLSCIRRSNADGYHYFIAALSEKNTEGWMPLSVQARSAMFFNPMNGESGKARLRQHNGKTEVFMQLSSGESIILKTFTEADVNVKAWKYYTEQKADTLDRWQFKFIAGTPAVSNVPDSVSTGSWTDLNFEGAKTTMGTACYTTTFSLEGTPAEDYILSLGDVRESARVRINGQDAGTLWAVPYRCSIGKFLHAGKNTIEIEVTNLPANRIAEMDRKGVNWRIFKDINIAALGYKKGNYAGWEPVPSGLLGPVQIISVTNKKQIAK